MGYISNWVRSIATVTMMMAAVTVLTPKNTAGRAAMLCGSILLTAVLVSPIKTFDIEAVSEYDRKFELEIEKRAEAISREGEKVKETIIEENLRTYILQRAKQFGISCDIAVACRDGMPHLVTVRLKRKEDRERISEILTEECGIAKENQIFEVTE